MRATRLSEGSRCESDDPGTWTEPRQAPVLASMKQVADEGASLRRLPQMPALSPCPRSPRLAARRALVSAAPYDYPTPGVDEYRHLAYWIAALEHLGVLVMQTRGSQIGTDEMRAFSRYFDEVPVIALNGADWPRGGCSRPSTSTDTCSSTRRPVRHDHGPRARTEDRQLEARCNAIAAEILMPAADVLHSEMVQQRTAGHEWTLVEPIDAASPLASASSPSCAAW